MKVRWSPEAARNFSQIYEYLYGDESPFTQSTVKTIYEGIYSLEQMPYRGRPGRVAGTRELLFSRLPFIVIYRIKDDTIELVSIRHTSQNPIY